MRIVPNRYLALLGAPVALLVGLALSGELRADNAGEHWVAAWATSVQPPSLRTVGTAATGFEERSLRMILRPTIGGARLRLRICNSYGKFALLLDDVRIAPRASGSDIRPERAQIVTFHGQKSIRIAPGGNVLSDPVPLALTAGEDLAVDLHLPLSSGPPTWHAEANRISYISARGNYAGVPHWDGARPVLSWFFICGLDVTAPRSTRAVVLLGDSVTDGTQSSIDFAADWPSVLARRLAEAGRKDIAVINAGISGNRLRDGGGVGDSARPRRTWSWTSFGRRSRVG